MMSRKIFHLFITILVLASFSTAFAQSDRQSITVDNASSLTELIRLGRGSAEEVQYLPDGSAIAIASTVGVWLYDPANLATETEPVLLPSEAEVQSIAISPDSSTLAVSQSGDVFLWDIASQTFESQLETSYGVDRMAFSPDGSLLALNNGSRGVALWDLAANSEVLLEGSFRSDAELHFSADGAWLGAVGSDNSVYLWDVANNSAGATLAGHTSTLESFSFNPDATLLASGAADRSLRFWNPADGTEIANITTIGEEDLDYVNKVLFSPDGSLLASGHSDGQIILWDAASQTPSLEISSEDGVADLAFSPDGSQLISVHDDNSIHAWEVSSGSLLASAVGHTAYMNALTFSPDSSTLAFTDYHDNLWLWNSAEMSEINGAILIAGGGDTSTTNLEGVAYSSDGSLIASIDGFAVKLYDAATQQLRFELEGDGIVEGLAFSPDDTLLAYISSSGLYLFDVATGQLLSSLEVHNDWLTSVAFSPDQTLIATASSDHTVRVYGLPQ